jgi:hypothetical protein
MSYIQQQHGRWIQNTLCSEYPMNHKKCTDIILIRNPWMSESLIIIPLLASMNCHNNKPYLRRLIYFPEVLSKQKGLCIWTDDLNLTLSNDHDHSSVVIMRIENSRFSAKTNQFYPKCSWKLTNYKSTFSHTHTYIRFENLISWVVTRGQRSTSHGGLDRWRDVFDETNVSARIPVHLDVPWTLCLPTGVE